MQDNNQQLGSLEQFYDVFDASCSYLYECTKKRYFDLILLTAKNILAGEVLNDLEKEQIDKLNEIYKPLADIDFSVEDIRKAMQAQVLKGIKEMNLENGLVTPDSIGIFMTYLISRLNPKDKKEISILDPLLGSGNLLMTIANHLNLSLKLYGCDHNEWFTKLAKALADLINEPIDIYLQDTLNLNLCGLDYIVFDMPNLNSSDNYFPYDAILHYRDMLNDGGFIIGVLGNDFFDHDKDGKFKKELTKDSEIIGIVELPDGFFQTKPKSIVVIQKKIWEKKECFMVKLPNFTDVNAFNQALMKLEVWFDKYFKKES